MQREAETIGCHLHYPDTSPLLSSFCVLTRPLEAALTSKHFEPFGHLYRAALVSSPQLQQL